MTTPDLAVPPSPPGGDRAIKRAADTRSSDGTRDAGGQTPFAQIVLDLSTDPVLRPKGESGAEGEDGPADGTRGDATALPLPDAGVADDLATLLANVLNPSSTSQQAVPAPAVATPQAPDPGTPPRGGAVSGLPRPRAGSGTLVALASADDPSEGAVVPAPGQVQVIAREAHLVPVGGPSPSVASQEADSQEDPEAVPGSGLADSDPGAAASPPSGEGATKPNVPSPRPSPPRDGSDDPVRRPIQPVQTAARSEESGTAARTGRVDSSAAAFAVDAAPASVSASTPSSQETRVPGGLVSSVPTQIAGAIQDEVERSLDPVGHVPSGTVAPAVSGGVMHVLKIELRPADLGLVTVEMRLKDGRLEASLRASRQETADYLRESSTAIADLLNHSGYRTEIVVIERARPPAPPSPSSGQHPSANFGGDRSNGGGERRQPTERGGDDRTEPGDKRVNATDGHRDSGGGSHLFV